MPHKTKLPRKPKGVGTEIKSLACGDTGIILKLEIMEGKEANRKKDYFQQYGEGTAVTLRLTKEYYGSGRVVHADSAFSLVKTLLALQERGLYFMGMVKTTHKEYPLAYLQSWGKGQEDEAVPARGDFCLLETQAENGIPFYALGWANKKMKTIVSNVGSTLSGTPCKRKRHKKEEVNGVLETVVYFKEVKRPAMIEQFFSCFGIIDRHDHYRQGSLQLEREWCTHKWWHRIFTTVFGMCVVDSFMAYTFEVQSTYGTPDDFLTFMGKLAYELINNVLLGQGIVLRDKLSEEQVILL